MGELFVIRHKITKEVIAVPSGKTSFKAVNHAKLAWNTFSIHHCGKLGLNPVRKNSHSGLREFFPKFHEQDVYEIVNIQEEGENLKVEMTKFLNMVQGRLNDDELEQKAKELLIQLKGYFNE